MGMQPNVEAAEPGGAQPGGDERSPLGQQGPGREDRRRKGNPLPRQELLRGCARAAELEPLIEAAETALRTWEPVWSGFLDAQLREEAEARLGGLSELVVDAEGGYPGAERRRLLLQRAEAVAASSSTCDAPADGSARSEGLLGLEISGNFLFDPSSAADFWQGMTLAGAGAEELGDVWVRGDRGAQAIVTEELARRLDGRPGLVRTVEVVFEARPIQRLQLPADRQPRAIATVEASLRLDAVASAGFGLSRQRMVDRIRAGAVRINWQPVTSTSRELAVDDRVRLEGKGELRIASITPTKRGRFRIEMVRS